MSDNEHDKDAISQADCKTFAESAKDYVGGATAVGVVAGAGYAAKEFPPLKEFMDPHAIGLASTMAGVAVAHNSQHTLEQLCDWNAANVTPYIEHANQWAHDNIANLDIHGAWAMSKLGIDTTHSDHASHPTGSTNGGAGAFDYGTVTGHGDHSSAVAGHGHSAGSDHSHSPGHAPGHDAGGHI